MKSRNSNGKLKSINRVLCLNRRGTQYNMLLCYFPSWLSLKHYVFSALAARLHQNKQ